MDWWLDGFENRNGFVVAPALADDEGSASDGAESLFNGTQVRIAVE